MSYKQHLHTLWVCPHPQPLEWPIGYIMNDGKVLYDLPKPSSTSYIDELQGKTNNTKRGPKPRDRSLTDLLGGAYNK